MKQLSYLCRLLTLLLLSVSCAKNNANDLVTSLTLSANKTTITADGVDAVQITVKTQKGVDVTNEATLLINDKPVTGHTFTTTTSGFYTLKAAYKNSESNEVKIEAKAPLAALVLSADKEAVLANNKDQIIFKVATQNGDDVTLSCDIFVGTTKLPSNKFKTSKAGEYTAYAINKKGERSNELLIQANEERDLTLSADVLKVEVGSGAKITFSLKDKKGNDLTSTATFYIDNVKIEGNTFTPTEVKRYEAHAEYQQNVSNTLYVSGTPTIQYTDVEILASKSSFANDGIDCITLRAINHSNNDNDVTTITTFYVNGKKLDSNVISSKEYNKEGPLTLTATVKGNQIKSSSVTCRKDFSFTPRLYLEYFTGTWCPYCPRFFPLMEAANKHPQFVLAALHSQDEFNHRDANTVGILLEVKGYPTVVINRDSRWNLISTNFSDLLQGLPKEAPVGIAAHTSLNGSTLTGKVYLRSSEELNNHKLVMIITEDGKVANQRNLIFHGLGDPIPNQVHNHIYRGGFPNVWGTTIDIPGDKSLVEKEINISLSEAWKIENCHLVILITRPDNSVITSNVVKLGSQCGY